MASESVNSYSARASRYCRVVRFWDSAFPIPGTQSGRKSDANYTMAVFAHTVNSGSKKTFDLVMFFRFNLA